jgi:hypothetical protein
VVTADDVTLIRQLIAERPGASRRRLSEELCELPMGVRKSETVALVHPVMPVGDGFGGRDIGINSHQL